jgi:hypothetical protein
MTRCLMLAALLGLAACSQPAQQPAPVMLEEAEAVAETSAPARTGPADCLPGEGDGIGGTGCKVD